MCQFHYASTVGLHSMHRRSSLTRRKVTVEVIQCEELMAGPSPRIRFGPYAVDVRSGELWKSNTRLKVQDLPFKVLSLLLERPGDLVTRDELQARLWDNSTFVDFDHGLNSAVNKLRAALSDSASRPRYIETVGRRGYRFMATVEKDAAPHIHCLAVCLLPRRAMNPPPNIWATP